MILFQVLKTESQEETEPSNKNAKKENLEGSFVELENVRIYDLNSFRVFTIPVIHVILFIMFICIHFTLKHVVFPKNFYLIYSISFLF